MRKIIPLLGVLLSLYATSALATVDLAGLTPEQEHQLQIQADQLKQQAATPAQQAQKISEYAEIGKGVAQAVGAAAKELSVGVNDFAKTPVGALTLNLIVFKVLEHRIVSTITGVLWIVLFTPVWLYFYRKLWVGTVTVEYENGKKKRVTRSPITRNEWSDLEFYRISGAIVAMVAVGVGLILFH